MKKHFTNTNNPIDFPSFDQEAFNLIVDLRGGIPETCDFCKQRFTDQRCPVPEEAGDWACIECVRRWEQEEQDGRA